jgi:hypothetical protein
VGAPPQSIEARDKNSKTAPSRGIAQVDFSV